MKRVLKGQEPQELIAYRSVYPYGNWESSRNDVAYTVCRHRLVHDQLGLCAYCEIDIAADKPLQCRVEHFHPKSDSTPELNWALDWQNFLGVCAGGSQRYDLPPYSLEPLRENLSCEAFKDTIIQTGGLQVQCEGWILSPTQMFAFPCLFDLQKSTGRLFPNAAGCALVANVEGNRHATIALLVEHTIGMLNLNCDRLCVARRRIIWDIERNKKKQREQGFTPLQGMRNLAEHYLRNSQTNWPRFFTTIRICLGVYAEAQLEAIGFQG